MMDANRTQKPEWTAYVGLEHTNLEKKCTSSEIGGIVL